MQLLDVRDDLQDERCISSKTLKRFKNLPLLGMNQNEETADKDKEKKLRINAV